MPHLTAFDSTDQVLTVAVDGLWTEKDAVELEHELQEHLLVASNRTVALDLKTAIRYEGTEARRRTAKILRDRNVTHLAIFNARPAVRILVKILMQLTAESTKGRFFPTREEAIAWIQQERQGK